MTQSNKRSLGTVYLVGAGSGDPGLITVRGAELLARADVVVYDYLSNPQLLNRAPSAQAIYVGKKAASHSMTQEQINELLVEQARAGRRVVRLKGGDPFVFGRGGEECEALAAAGIPFEVVPGVTAAIAAPAYAGIPVTHRDLNSSFTFITGHEKEEAYRDDLAKSRELGGASDLDWAALAKLPCISFYMGVKSLPRICQKLIEFGMDPKMPAATIRWGTTPKQRTVVGTVADLPEKVAQAKLGPPALTIIGRVVSLRETMNWFETRPLFGQTIVVTRTRQQASDLTRKLTELGANVIEAPTIELVPQPDQSLVDGALRSIATTTGSSSPARMELASHASDCRNSASTPAHSAARKSPRLAIPPLGRFARSYFFPSICVRQALSPRRWLTRCFAANEVTGKRYLLLRADIARPLLRDRLRASGAAEVVDVPIYQTGPAKALPEQLLEAIAEQSVNWVTFTSSSTATNFMSLLGANYAVKLQNVKLASIGPITSQTLKARGTPPTVEASVYDIGGLVDAILR